MSVDGTTPPSICSAIAVYRSVDRHAPRASRFASKYSATHPTRCARAAAWPAWPWRWPAACRDLPFCESDVAWPWDNAPPSRDLWEFTSRITHLTTLTKPWKVRCCGGKGLGTRGQKSKVLKCFWTHSCERPFPTLNFRLETWNSPAAIPNYRGSVKRLPQPPVPSPIGLAPRQPFPVQTRVG